MIPTQTLRVILLASLASPSIGKEPHGMIATTTTGVKLRYPTREEAEIIRNTMDMSEYRQVYEDLARAVEVCLREAWWVDSGLRIGLAGYMTRELAMIRNDLQRAKEVETHGEAASRSFGLSFEDTIRAAARYKEVAFPNEKANLVKMRRRTKKMERLCGKA